MKAGFHSCIHITIITSSSRQMTQTCKYWLAELEYFAPISKLDLLSKLDGVVHATTYNRTTTTGCIHQVSCDSSLHELVNVYGTLLHKFLDFCMIYPQKKVKCEDD